MVAINQWFLVLIKCFQQYYNHEEFIHLYVSGLLLPFCLSAIICIIGIYVDFDFQSQVQQTVGFNLILQNLLIFQDAFIGELFDNTLRNSAQFIRTLAKYKVVSVHIPTTSA